MESNGQVHGDRRLADPAFPTADRNDVLNAGNQPFLLALLGCCVSHGLLLLHRSIGRYKNPVASRRRTAWFMIRQAFPTRQADTAGERKKIRLDPDRACARFRYPVPWPEKSV